MQSPSNNQLRALGERYRAETEFDLNEALEMGLDPASEFQKLIWNLSAVDGVSQVPDLPNAVLHQKHQNDSKSRLTCHFESSAIISECHVLLS